MLLHKAKGTSASAPLIAGELRAPARWPAIKNATSE